MSTKIELSDEQSEKLVEVAEHYFPEEDATMEEVIEHLCDQQLSQGFGPEYEGENEEGVEE